MRRSQRVYGVLPGVLCAALMLLLSACGQKEATQTQRPEMLSLATPEPTPTPVPIKEGYAGTLYTHPETGYTIYYNPDWEMQESLPEQAMENIGEEQWETAQRYHALLFILPVGEKEFTASVSVTVMRSDGVTTQSLQEEIRDVDIWLSLESDPIPDFEVVSGPETKNFDGNSGVELVFRGSYDGHRYYWRHVAFAGKDTVYLFTLTCGSSEQMDTFLKDFNTMANSLTILNKGE